MGQPHYVVFDTETTGIFEFKDKATGKPVPADAPGQPRMASLAAIIADADGEELDRVRLYVRPDGWSIDGTEASAVNGLTDDFLRRKGIPVTAVLDLWRTWVGQGLIIAAFNAQFDCKMMRAELRRAGRPDLFEETRNICLMRGLKPYHGDGLPIRGGFIKLSAACEFFGIPQREAHDAMSDTEDAFALLKIMIRDGRVPDAKVHYAKEA